MKKILFVLLFFTILVSASANTDLKERIQHFGGTNAASLLDLLANSHPDTLQYIEFLLQNASDSDLSILTKDYLLDNIRFALKSRHLPFADYDDEIFLHFVLPHRMSQEPLENWRPVYYNELLPLVENCQEIEEAAILVNLWCLEQMTYKPTHGRDQSAFTSAKRGFGRCEEMMIIYMCAARAVGIPVRSCSAPYWNFTDSNHAWIEVWTPEGWKYLGEPAAQLSKTWFTRTTERATLVTSKVFGNYEHSSTIKQEDNVTTLSSIGYYTQSYDCHINVFDEFGEPVPDAVIIPYAVSFGGIFPMIDISTNEDGSCKIPLGKGSVFIIAAKDNKKDWIMLTNLEGNDEYLEFNLSEKYEINERLSFLFPIPSGSTSENSGKPFLEHTFDLRRQNADLKRKNRLCSQKLTAEFAHYYDLVNEENRCDDDYFKEREEFLLKSDELAANADDFVYVLQKTDSSGRWIITEMIETWDIKDLCEIPDSTALMNIVNIFSQNRYRYAESDSLFSSGCIARTWHSASPVQNGWQNNFYQLIEPYLEVNAEETVNQLSWWVKENTETEDKFAWNYYSGSLNPLQMYNLRYINEDYQDRILNSALKLAGIPVRWKGELQFHNGKSWQKVHINEDIEDSDNLQHFSLNIYVDQEQVKAEPFDNFLLASFDKEGAYLYYTWFDGELDSLTFAGEYRPVEDGTIHLIAAVRNSNGDASVFIEPVTEEDQNFAVYLTTPREYLDISTTWEKNLINELLEVIVKPDDENSKIIVILGQQTSEPQEHTLRQLAETMPEYSKKNASLYIYSEGSSSSFLMDEKFSDACITAGNPILSSLLQPEEYPAVFVFDTKDELIFSTTGYNMGIAELIKKKLK